MPQNSPAEHSTLGAAALAAICLVVLYYASRSPSAVMACPRWIRVAGPFLAASLLSSVAAILPVGILSDEQVVVSFYTAAACVLVSVSLLIARSRAVRLSISAAGAGMVAAVTLTDSVIAGATTHNGILTKVAGPAYCAFLLFAVLCILAQMLSIRGRIRDERDPCERNRMRYGAIALGANQIAAIACAAAMTSDEPLISGPTTLPFTMLFGIVLAIYAHSSRSLPLLAARSSSDRALSEEHEDAILFAMGQSMIMPHSEAIESMIDDLIADGVMPPTRGRVHILSYDEPPFLAELTALGWNRRLERLVRDLLTMRPAEVRPPQSVSFGAGVVTNADRVVYSRPRKNMD